MGIDYTAVLLYGVALGDEPPPFVTDLEAWIDDPQWTVNDAAPEGVSCGALGSAVSGDVTLYLCSGLYKTQWDVKTLEALNNLPNPPDWPFDWGEPKWRLGLYQW